MRVLQQIAFSIVMVAVVACATFALLGSCSSQAAASQAAQESAPAASSSAEVRYNSAGIELATREEWTRLQEAILAAQDYTDPTPHSEERWDLFERAKSMANRTMMDYPNRGGGDVNGAAQQLESCMLLLDLEK